MNLGFSYTGLIFLLMLIIPNIIWIKFQPQNYEQYAKNENKVLQVLERIGEALVTVTALTFIDFNINTVSLWTLWLAAAFLLMILYEIYWIRYFCSKRTMMDFYSSLLGIPVAGATLPVAAFFLLSIYGKNPILLIFVIILGVGHIGIHTAGSRNAFAQSAARMPHTQSERPTHRKEAQNEHLPSDRRS